MLRVSLRNLLVRAAFKVVPLELAKSKIFCNVSLMTMEYVQICDNCRNPLGYLRFCKLCKSHSKASLSTLTLFAYSLM